MRVTAVGWDIEHALATLDSVVESVSDTEARLLYVADASARVVTLLARIRWSVEPSDLCGRPTTT